MVIERKNSISINTVIELRDVIFDENKLNSISKPNDILPENKNGKKNEKLNEENLEPRRSKRIRKAKDFGPDFFMYLVERTTDSVRK